MLRIRTAEEDDLAWLGPPAAVADFRSALRQAWQRRARGEVVVLVAEAGGRPAGRVFVDVRRRPAYLWSLAVAPALRGGGVGSALLAEAERVAAEAGADAIELGVGFDNDRARALYERLGYAEAGTVVDEWVDVQADGRAVEVRETCCLLRKALG